MYGFLYGIPSGNPGLCFKKDTLLLLGRGVRYHSKMGLGSISLSSTGVLCGAPAFALNKIS